MLEIYTGNFARGYETGLRARALGRFSPYSFWYDATCGIGAGLSGQHEQAIRHGERAIRKRPEFCAMIRHLIVSHSLSGNLARAQELLAQFQTLEPEFSIRRMRESRYPVGRAAQPDVVEACLRAAGVPE
jgi:hypothetical protein